LAVVEGNTEGEVEVDPHTGMAQTDFGFTDGTGCYLRSFPVNYASKKSANDPIVSGSVMKYPKTGEAGRVTWSQTMSTITLSYPLEGVEASYEEDSLTVQMSSWELQVVIGAITGKKSGLKTIPEVSGELMWDIRRKLSTWKISDYDGKKFLEIDLVKEEHRAWATLWKAPFQVSHHKKAKAGWSMFLPQAKDQKNAEGVDETLAPIAAGLPDDVEHNKILGMSPEEIVTGVTFEQDEEYVCVLVHLDEEQRLMALGRLPMGDFFKADIESEWVEVTMKGDNLPVVWAVFSGHVLPQFSAWEFKEVRREPPQGSSIEDKTFMNMALKITMKKAQPGLWGDIYTEMQHPEYNAPKQRTHTMTMPTLNKCMVLAPTSPDSTIVKTERALKMVTKVTTGEDVVLNKAYVYIHLWDGLEEYIRRFQVDVFGLFSLEVKETMLRAYFVADAEYVMCEGGFGGECDPARASFDMQKDTEAGQSKEHIMLKVTLSKAPSARGKKWGINVFKQLEPHQISNVMIDGLMPLEPEPEETETQRDGE